MTSEQKIKEARFFLELINEYYHDNEKCQYCISAFLHAAYDFFDQTLEEYSDEFGLKITMNDKLDILAFAKTAKNSDNKPAVKFALLYSELYFKLLTNSVAAAMLKTRNVNTHRFTLLNMVTDFDGVQHFLSDVEELDPVKREHIKKFIQRKIRQLNEVSKELGANEKTISDQELDVITNRNYEHLYKLDLRDVCKAYLQSLDSFITAIRAKNPRW